MRLKILFLLAILISAIFRPVQAGDFELYVGDESMQFSYLTSAALLGTSEQDLNFGILLTQERDIVGSMGLTMPGLLGDKLPEWLSIAFGFQGYFALISDPREIEVFSIAPGVDCRLTLPTKMSMHLTGSFYYSPKIITFGDADDMFDFTARYEVGFTPNAAGFIGYRLLSYDQEDNGSDIDVDEGVHIGFRIAY